MGDRYLSGHDACRISGHGAELVDAVERSSPLFGGYVLTTGLWRTCRRNVRGIQRDLCHTTDSDGRRARRRHGKVGGRAAAVRTRLSE